MSKKTDMNQRLAALPKKIAVPFQKLLVADQINEEALTSILDAGELTGEFHKLLGFAIGYLSLRSQGVPVHDVIKMAKAKNRRINLNWGAKRWNHEHDRLSRAEALSRLSEENIKYDVSKYEAHLPDKFDGYLIRTSRRLGMEGLRQRHCVGSYHPQLQSGTCGIATVFVKRKRWTVQLFLTKNPDVPLRIYQIKSRFNEMPTNEIRDEIFKTLDIEPNQPTNQTGTQTHTYLATLRRILPHLREHNVEKVIVSFDGSGDSGSIDYISYLPHSADDVKNITIEYETTTSHLEDGQWIKVSEITENSINDAIEELTNDYLEETDVNWYNDDGGFGELTINVQRETVSLEVNVRFVESITEFNSERDIATGEEV